MRCFVLAVLAVVLLTGCTLKNPALNVPYDVASHCRDNGATDVSCVIDVVDALEPECDKYKNLKNPDLRAMYDAGTLNIYEMYLIWMPLSFGAAHWDDDDGDGVIDWANVFYVPQVDNMFLYHELIHVKGNCKDQWF